MSIDQPTRTYRSAVRASQAADTRRRILAAARDLFSERGFAGTTVAAVAERARVAAPTVYAGFGGKAGLVAALVEILEGDADAPAWRARLDAQLDGRSALDLFAAWSAHLYGTSRRLLAAIVAAGGDPGIASLHADGDRNRRAWLQPIITLLASSGELLEGVGEAEALDRAWAVTGYELYQRTVEGCGWSDTQYRHWLAALLHQQVCR